MSITAALGDVREIRLSRGTVRYRESGEGPPVVFVHGLLVNGDLWRGVAPSLAAGGRRCIVPDWPLGSHELPMDRGADLSPPGLAAIVAEFLAALDLRDVTLVANDTGGAIAQILVTTSPDRVGRLVLTPCDAFDNFLPPIFMPLKYVVGYVPGAALVVANSLRPRLLQRAPFAFGWLAKRPIPRDISRSYLGSVLSNRGARRDVAKALRGVSARHTLAAAKNLPSFDRPVLIAWAREDRVFPYEHAERLAKLFPDARLEPIEDSYSFVPEDQPARLASLIADFAPAA